MKYCTDADGKVYQLQRCPFCGMEVAEIYTQSERDDLTWKNEDHPERYTIVCSFSSNGCGATCGYHDTVAMAVARWNTRVVI